jgi:hypothetical protein
MIITLLSFEHLNNLVLFEDVFENVVFFVFLNFVLALNDILLADKVRVELFLPILEYFLLVTMDIAADLAVSIIKFWVVQLLRHQCFKVVF